MMIRREAGVTLIELILVVVLVGILAIGASQLLLQGMGAWLAADTRSDLTSQGRLAMERMTREIRTIRSRTAADIPTFNAGTLSFVDLSGAAVTYTSGGGTLTRNGTALASAATLTLGFLYYQQDGVTPAGIATEIWIIQIDLTVQNGQESQTFRARVHPRNFV